MRFTRFYHLVQLLHVDCVVSQDTCCYIPNEGIGFEGNTASATRQSIVDDARAGLVGNGINVFQYFVLHLFQLNHGYGILIC